MSKIKRNYHQEDLAFQGIIIGIMISLLLCLGWSVKSFCERIKHDNEHVMLIMSE